MKIHSINNQAFGTLIINNEEQTPVQKAVIKRVLKNKFLTNKLLNKLEDEYLTDVVVSANPDGRTVDLSLLTTSVFSGFKYIPYDKNGRKYMTTIKPKVDGINVNIRDIFIQSALFFKHILNFDLSSEKNSEEEDKLFE